MSTTAPLPAREDPRIAKTHEALVEALMDLAAVTSWERVTVAALCRRARVHRATFYAHYENKDDLLTRCLPAFFDRLTGPGAWAAFLSHCRENNAFYRRALETTEFRALLTGYLRRHALDHGARQGVALDFTCAGILGVVESYVADPGDPTTTAESLAQLLQDRAATNH